MPKFMVSLRDCQFEATAESTDQLSARLRQVLKGAHFDQRNFEWLIEPSAANRKRIRKEVKPCLVPPLAPAVAPSGQMRSSGPSKSKGVTRVLRRS